MAKKVFLFCSIILLVFALSVRIYISNNYVFKNNVITREEFDSIISNREKYNGEIYLRYNNEFIPYDKANDYYLLSQIQGEKYNGFISIDGFDIDVLEQEKTKDEIIISNDSIVLLAHNNDSYKIINLKLTYLPVIKLDNSYGKVIIFDNDEQRESLNIKKHFMEYHARGATTAYFNKKSYKLNILDSKKNKKKVSLLNMREDDDWILNSMVMDKSYMLERTAYHIWEKMSNYNIQLRYVELFIDNEYRGIYCLQEPADFKTYSANNKSLLLSIKFWQVNIKNPILFNENLEYNSMIDEFELDSKIDNSKQIELLRSFVSDIRDTNYSSKIKLKYDIDSFANYSLFLNLIAAIDNEYKNQKVLFRYIDGEYVVEIHPWDLDYSQENEIIMSQYNYNLFSGNKKNNTTPKKYLNDEVYIEKINEKYNVLRKTIYTENYMNSVIDSYKNELIKSGAIVREETTWGKRDIEKSAQNLKEFYKKRIVFLDKYYGENNGI